MADSRKSGYQLSPDEIALLERYRGATAEGREAAMHALACLAVTGATSAYIGSRPEDIAAGAEDNGLTRGEHQPDIPPRT